MKVLSICSLVFLSAAVVFPSTAHAALEPDNHTGFYIGLGLGGGSVSVSTDNLESDAETSGAGQLRLGGALSQTVLLGVESNAWAKEYESVFGDNTTISVGNVAATVTFYPTNYFFIKGGPALGVVSVEFEPAGTNVTVSQDETGGGFMLGAGGELRLTEKFAIVPSAQWMWQRISTSFDGGDVDLDFSFFSITIGVGWFW